jgi:hypothetical protein
MREQKARGWRTEGRKLREQKAPQATFCKLTKDAHA